MTKRDRIAIVVSLGWWIFLFYGFGTFFDEKVLLWMIPVLLYWSYRFIKKDE
jgi:hypothetical protein